MNNRLKGWVKPVDVNTWIEVVQGNNVSQVLRRLKDLPYSDGDWQITFSNTPVPPGIVEVVAPKPLVGSFKEFDDACCVGIWPDELGFNCSGRGTQEGVSRVAVCT